MRRLALAAVLTASVLAAGPAVAAPASAATPAVRSVVAVLADPYLTDPVQVEVIALDAAGDPVPFSAAVTLRTWGTQATVPVSSTTGSLIVPVPTSTLSGGSAVLTVVARGGGGSASTTQRGFVVLPPSFAVQGFGCTVLASGGGNVPWAVSVLNGTPVAHPGWTPNSWDFPAYVGAVHPLTMRDSAQRPLATTGTMTVSSGRTTVATVPLPRLVRRMLFSVHWNALVNGRFRPGTYTARLTMKDAVGRTTTAVRQIHLDRSGTLPCA
ncbi:hypothetical protein QDR37_08640 [Amnibacterium sp. CER49]|uniref:hypothetical protein n=1 Tax=Amnibacterium sp. CER49 TaxID=3039161 RepID=UPI0024497DFD|nr:hypothetical protein [Amnibacterium sp. CER49]MDH2444009.1 hypothetical protein [Amnibacterium sp. CER49]